VMPGAPDVSIVVVNRNTRQLVAECLASVFEDAGGSHLGIEIIAVDNASTDGSPAMIAEQFPTVRLIRNVENLGYADGSNQGIRAARARHVFLLNSDTVVRPGTLETLVRFLDANADVGGAAPKLLNPDGTIQRSCWPFPLKALLGDLFLAYRLGMLDDYRSWDHRHDRQVDWVSSAALMVPRRVFDEVGMLDERFFYGADVEWAYRATKAGYRFMSLSRPEVVHHGRGSREWEGDPRFDGGPTVQARYFQKHHGALGLFLFRFSLIAGNFPRLLFWEVAHRLRMSPEADHRRTMCRRLIASALDLQPGAHP
jgi:GT2 family glycosyltransferase